MTIQEFFERKAFFVVVRNGKKAKPRQFAQELSRERGD
jgi:hypothetical protein